MPDPVLPSSSPTEESGGSQIGEDRIGEELSGRRVLLTGAGGFIGRHLARRLLALGASVHAVVRPDAPLPAGLDDAARVPCDLGDDAAVEEVVRSVRPDVVFHLASLVGGSRDVDLVLPMLEANAQAAISIMRSAGELEGCRVVLAGSVEEPHAQDEPPPSPYAAAKATTTSYARLFHEQYGLDVRVLRLAMVYGPDQPDTGKLVPLVVTGLLAGDAPDLSSGTRPVDWIYVDDVCEAFLRAAVRSDAGGLVADVGSGEAVTIADVVRRIAALIGWEGELRFGELDDRARGAAFIADVGAASDALGWSPRTSLDDGLARTVAWWRDHGPAGPAGAPRPRSPERSGTAVAAAGYSAR